jgi:N-acetylglucosamine-6-phosphate deacetylase
VISHEDPQAVMTYHRKNGTGAMLMTMYRTLGHEVTLEGIEKVKEAMKNDKGILGVHLEGPYLNPALGTAVAADVPRPDKNIYGKYLESGIIKMCTFAPELEGSAEFCRDLVANGVKAAMGHSAATYEQVHAAVEAGASVVTHVFNASEKTEGPISYRGTKNLDFDEACLLEDGLYYEVICDKKGIHVRPQMIKLLEKTVGKDRIVGITDCYGYDTVEETGEDVNIDDQGEISGSRMNMTCVARNFLALGYSLADVFAITSYNPACAIGVSDILGEIAEGKRANLLITDEKLSSVRYFEV